VRKNSIRTAMLLFAALTASFALAAGKITGFEAVKSGEGAIIKVAGTDLAQPNLQTAYGGSLAILEFQAVLTGKAEFTRLNTANVTYAKIAQFTAKPPVVRVVAKIKPAANIHLEQTTNGWLISIGATANAGLNLIEQAQRADQEAFKQAQQALGSGASSKGVPTTTGGTNKTATPQTSTVGTRATSPLEEIIEAAKRQDEKMFAEAMRQLRVPKPTATEPTSPKADAVTTTAEVKTATPTTVDTQKVSEPTLWTANTGGTSGPASAQRRVSLDFVDTQVVIILKALAEQSGANIVTAPAVQGTISVTLRNVTVQSALDLITKLAGVRYAYVDGTYIVGSPEFMRSMLIQDTGAASRNGTVMRVVPLASRKAGEIKRAITQAMTMDVLNETIQIINPAAPADQQPAAQNGQAGAQNGNQSAAPAMEGDADYLILIGEPGRVEQAQLLITQLDRGLAGIHGITEVGADALRPISKAYRVQGGRAAELAAAVEKFATGVSVVATPAGSRAEQSLVITGRPADVDRVLEVLAQIDDVTAGGEWVVEIYDVRHADPRALKAQVEESFETVRVAIGPQSATGRSFTPAAAGAGGQAGGPLGGASNQGSGGVATSAGFKASPQYGEDETRAVPMMLVLSGPREQVNQALDMMRKLDRKTPEIVLEARVVDANKEDLLKLGIDWSAVTGSAVKIINLNYGQPAGADGSPFSEITGRFAGPGWLATGIANIDKLVSRDKILARPNVRAMDGREAVVFMGDIVRYIKSIQATQNGITVEVGEEEVGVKLNVLPRVTRDGTIIMEVQPTLSFIKEFLEVPGGGQIPTTSIRTARSTLTIRNGDTIAIGGLITDEDRRQMVGVPILMDIPIIGHLFRRSTSDKVRREIVIFLSARIVEDEEASATPDGAPTSPSNGSGGGR
jgi:type II secretory pathway component GspD/PulD (secretin)